MATTAQIALREYLQTTYDPNREYVDGELQERNVGKTEHARVQALLTMWFVNHESEWRILVTTEQRVQVSADRVHIPDVTLVRPGALSEDILSAPPLCVLEILSPQDTYARTWERARDYTKMGVENIWLIDPGNRSGQRYVSNGWQEVAEFEIAGTSIRLNPADIFCSLDRSRTV
jgi:Uma2 family endonuclease